MGYREVLLHINIIIYALVFCWVNVEINKKKNVYILFSQKLLIIEKKK